MQLELPHLAFSSPPRHATPHTPEGVVVWQWWRLTCRTFAEPQVWQVRQYPKMARPLSPANGIGQTEGLEVATPTARGGEWSSPQVMRILERLDPFRCEAEGAAA